MKENFVLISKIYYIVETNFPNWKMKMCAAVSFHF